MHPYPITHAIFISVVPNKTDGYSIKQSSVSPTVTASATASAGSSVSKNGISQRTVQEVEKGKLFFTDTYLIRKYSLTIKGTSRNASRPLLDA